MRYRRKPIRLQTQRFFGAARDHDLGRDNFVVGAGRRGLHVDNHRYSKSIR